MFFVVTAFMPNNNNWWSGNYEKTLFKQKKNPVTGKLLWDQSKASKEVEIIVLYSFDMTGSNKGIKKNPKFLLLKFWQEIHKQQLEKLAAKVESEIGKKL